VHAVWADLLSIGPERLPCLPVACAGSEVRGFALALPNVAAACAPERLALRSCP
jgi:hypothetical protein